jgi:hypothetical protein
MAIETTAKYICDNCGKEISYDYINVSYHMGKHPVFDIIIYKPEDLLFCDNKCLKEYMDRMNVL